MKGHPSAPLLLVRDLQMVNGVMTTFYRPATHEEIAEAYAAQMAALGITV